ncbi:MAG TPA: hypothetical protein PK303_08875 [bacterium]|nr:hypothetical protein [bacterium]HPP09211.1 hypothetical protein [bacterium]
MDEKKITRLGSDPLSWIQDSRKQKTEAPSREKKIQQKMDASGQVSKQDVPKTKEGLKEGWIRATFIVREDYLEKIKAVSYWDRKDIKQVVDEALGGYLKNKKVKPKPKNER